MMEDKNISVVIDDRTVVIDGVGYKCEDFPVAPEGLHAIHWRPRARAPFGHYEWIGKPDSDKTFSNFGRVSGYADAWARAKAKDKEAALEFERKNRELREKHEAAAKAEQAERERQREIRRTHDEALIELRSSDHEILKAAEALLEKPGATAIHVDQALVTRRRELRVKVKAERQRLRAAGVLK
jgi:hypothetical protein